jgi:hypothetical protein
VLSDAHGNALAESESNLVISRRVWDYQEEVDSTGEVGQNG